jgi:hypothetical protein
MSGSIIPSDVAQRTEALVVACSRCDRAERYLVAKLIETYGAALPIPWLLRTLSADCPKRQSDTHYGQCGVHCPDLPALFRTG